MTPSERLVERLREYVDLPEGTRLLRTRAGRVQRQAAAWSWYAVGPDGVELNLGSQLSMTTLLNAERLEVNQDRRDRDRHVDLA